MYRNIPSLRKLCLWQTPKHTVTLGIEQHPPGPGNSRAGCVFGMEKERLSGRAGGGFFAQCEVAALPKQFASLKKPIYAVNRALQEVVGTQGLRQLLRSCFTQSTSCLCSMPVTPKYSLPSSLCPAVTHSQGRCCHSGCQGIRRATPKKGFGLEKYVMSSWNCI